MNQNEIHETENTNNNQHDLTWKLAKLQEDANEINKQLRDFSISDTNNNQNFSRQLEMLKDKQRDMDAVQGFQKDTFRTVFEGLTVIQNRVTDEGIDRDEFQSRLAQELSELREEFKKEQKNRKETSESLQSQQEKCAESIQKLSEELEVIEKDKLHHSSHQNAQPNSSNNTELADMKKKQDTQEAFNQEVIKEIKAMKREIDAFAKKEDKENNKNIIPIEKEITGIWKPSSLTEYKHYVKGEDEVTRSHWLSGQLLYALNENQFTYKLIVNSDEMKDVVKETTLTLGKRMKYKDHTETWTFENNHLVIIFRNKTDESIIKKHFQFFLDGKLHIVYHDLVNDVTSTRIYERVI